MSKSIFCKIIDYLYSQREQLIKLEAEVQTGFDYPDYGGLPKSISNRLSPEAVDAMQAIWHRLVNFGSGDLFCFEKNRPFKSKKEFTKTYKEKLEILGEKIK